MTIAATLDLFDSTGTIVEAVMQCHVAISRPHHDFWVVCRVANESGLHNSSQRASKAWYLLRVISTSLMHLHACSDIGNITVKWTILRILRYSELISTMITQSGHLLRAESPT